MGMFNKKEKIFIFSIGLISIFLIRQFTKLDAPFDNIIIDMACDMVAYIGIPLLLISVAHPISAKWLK